MPTKIKTHRPARPGKVHTQPRNHAVRKWYSMRRWKRLRRMQLITEPLCRACKKEGRDVAGTTVDHIVPHRGDYELFFTEDNLQTLCKRHHDRKTGRGE